MYNFKKNNQKGFTLAELLIVVAIIAVLIAIMIPTFGGQLEKARESADLANLRAAYAEATIAYINNQTSGNVKSVATDSSHNTTIVVQNMKFAQTDGKWTNDDDLKGLPFTLASGKVPNKTNTEVTFKFDSNGIATIDSFGPSGG